ncbi:hypothetical protein CBM2604_B130285 [Cupriavidus taiwanensis]|nr:hypothetical protein CBM2604_B130285 [Cupriavidus taiwanensis]SOZ47405.1 hypothetical protein CBM2610_B100287 [Cupriavidus taiwanensis]
MAEALCNAIQNFRCLGFPPFLYSPETP